MGQLNSFYGGEEYFTFDGVSSENVLKNYRLKMVDNPDNKNDETIFGVDRDINVENYSGNEYASYTGFVDKCQDYDITLYKSDNNGFPARYVEEDIHIIKRWMCKAGFKPLVINGYTYYIMVNKSSVRYFPHNKGYITFSVRSFPYRYKYNSVSKHIEKNQELVLSNHSDCSYSQILIYAEVNMIYGNSFSLKNKNNDEEFYINNLDQQESFEIKGHQHAIISKLDPKKNLYILSNKIFPKLEYGDNTILINATEADVILMYTEVFLL